MRICTVQEMRDCDRTAVANLGLSVEILMENAGHAVCEAVKREFGIRDRRFTIVCGAGNNGGDGFAAARLLRSMGADVRVTLLADESDISGAARANLHAAVLCGVTVQRLVTADELYLGRSSDVVIDAIFGTGLSRSPEGLHAEVIERLNRAAMPVLAVDIPSGVNGDTGMTPGPAVKATCTVALGLPKRGNLLCPGRELCGRLHVSHISFPPSLYNAVGDMVAGELTPLPDRPLESHKGVFGDVLFVAGARSYLGAPYLAAMSFLKAGGGYARLAAPESLAALLGTNACEAVMVPLQETVGGSSALANLDVLRDLSDRVDMMVIGPGVSLEQETQELVRMLVSSVSVPVLVDGDGLTAVAGDPACLQRRTAPTVLTPHAGEMARLLKTTPEVVQRDRVAAVQKATEELRAVVVLKGASTIVGSPGDSMYLNLSGNPGMATAGCGDVLSGTIAAMYGAGLDLRSAVDAGVFIHGVSGDLAAQAKGQDGIIARDVMECLPLSVQTYRQRFSELMNNHYGLINVI